MAAFSPSQDLSELKFCPIVPSQIYSISAWTYEPPYDIYNLVYPPEAEDIDYWLDPNIYVQAIVNPWNVLVAFCSFGLDGQVPGGDYSEEALDIGMGVRPDLTGRGHGATLVEATCRFAASQYRPEKLRVTVASQNARALRVWQKQGFTAIEEFTALHTDMRFDILIRDCLR